MTELEAIKNRRNSIKSAGKKAALEACGFNECEIARIMEKYNQDLSDRNNYTDYLCTLEQQRDRLEMRRANKALMSTFIYGCAFVASTLTSIGFLSKGSTNAALGAGGFALISLLAVRVSFGSINRTVEVDERHDKNLKKVRIAAEKKARREYSVPRLQARHDSMPAFFESFGLLTRFFSRDC